MQEKSLIQCFTSLSFRSHLCVSHCWHSNTIVTTYKSLSQRNGLHLTSFIHEFHIKISQKNTSVLWTESPGVAGTFKCCLPYGTSRELKIRSFGGFLVRFLRLQAKWWKTEVLPLQKSLQFSYCQTRWNRIFIKILKEKKKRSHYWEKRSSQQVQFYILTYVDIEGQHYL